MNFKNKYLVASDNVNEDEHVRRCNEPRRLLERHQNIVVDFVAKYVIPNKCNREIAYRHHNIGEDHPLPHRLLRWLLRRRRDCCLNLEHHVVAGEGERDVPQCIKEVKSILRCVLPPQPVPHVRRCALRQRRCPRNRGIPERPGSLHFCITSHATLKICVDILVDDKTKNELEKLKNPFHFSCFHIIDKL